MSTSLGIDLVSIAEVQEAIGLHGDRYLSRIYTAGERRDCCDRPRRLAACFAAKEATIKALRRSDEGLTWTSMDCRSDSTGNPTIRLSGTAAALARQRGVDRVSVSITHGPDHAAAIVIMKEQR